MSNLGLLDKLPFGKYKGQVIQDVYRGDAAYLVWMRNAKVIEQPTFFAAEMHPLLDDTIKKSKSLKGKYKLWGDMVPTTQTPFVPEPGQNLDGSWPAPEGFYRPEPPTPETSYADTWGAF